MRRALLLAALLWPAAAPAQQDPQAQKPPRVCPTQLSTPSVDLGFFRGAYEVTYADGARLGQESWHACHPAPVGGGPEKSWDSCTFSMCDLPEARFAVRVADTPAPPLFTFRIYKHYLFLDHSDIVAPAGNYGVDATGALVKLPINLQGYALDWHIAHWPEIFQGRETHGRATHDGPVLTVQLYPGGPYDIAFAGAHAAVSIGADRRVSVAPGGPLTLRDGVAVLRLAHVAITPPEGAWSADGTAFTGAQTLLLPAGSQLHLRSAGGAEQILALDGACALHPGPGPFTATSGQGCT